MFHLKLDNRYGKKWFKDKCCSVSGYLFYRNELYRENALGHLISSQEFRSGLPALLREVNGFFSVVYQGNGILWAAVDRVRSMPLFYGRKDNDLFISDDAYWVRKQVNHLEMNELALTEFLVPAYITGPDTLFPNVKQLQAGECLIAQNSPFGLSIATDRYYQYLHRNFSTEDFATLLEHHDAMLTGVFERLTRSVDGRTVVIPLSGGYDSRLVALMLKSLNFQNVICFSFGAPENEESQVSKLVAENLGFKWLFIPYTKECWLQWTHSEEYQGYNRYADNLCTRPHIQIWPAVGEMKKQRLVADDSVFVPGNSGDFFAGMHLLPALSSIRGVGHSEAIRVIKEIMYDYRFAVRLFRGDREKELDQKITDLISNIPANTKEEVLGAYDYWSWQEREAKFLVNAVRNYEFWGYEWRIPLWDREMMAFWEQVPVVRNGTRLYDTYVIRLGDKYALPEKPVRKWSIARNLVRSVSAFSRLDGFIIQYKRKRRRSMLFGYGGIIPAENWQDVSWAAAPSHLYCAKKRIEEIRNNMPNYECSGP